MAKKRWKSGELKTSLRGKSQKESWQILFHNFFKYLNFMDLGQIIYIVAIVGYFLYKASSKKKGNALPDTESDTPQSPQKGLTFEDLLREIREAQTPKIPELEPEPTSIPKPKSTFTIPQQDRPVVQSSRGHEDVVSEGEDYEGTYSPTKKKPAYREESSTDPVSKPARPVTYELVEERPNPYAELLKDPKSFRDAVVVSEILKPKHF